MAAKASWRFPQEAGLRLLRQQEIASGTLLSCQPCCAPALSVQVQIAKVGLSSAAVCVHRRPQHRLADRLGDPQSWVGSYHVP